MRLILSTDRKIYVSGYSPPSLNTGHGSTCPNGTAPSLTAWSLQMELLVPSLISEKQTGKVSVGFPMPCSASAFPRQEPTAETVQPTLFRRFDTKSCPPTHTTTQSLLSEAGGSPSPPPHHLHVLTHSCLGSCSPKPFLSPPRHVSKPRTSFKKRKLRFHTGSNIPAITQAPRPLPSLHSHSDGHLSLFHFLCFYLHDVTRSYRRANISLYFCSAPSTC